MNNKLPALMKENAIGIQIEGTDSEIYLSDIDRWPNRGEFKQLGRVRKLFLYNGDKLLLETAGCRQAQLPDIFGLRFKRVVTTHVDFKSKIQNITAIFKTYDLLNAVEEMHEMTGYDA
jgi:hypothetical protein